MSINRVLYVLVGLLVVACGRSETSARLKDDVDAKCNSANIKTISVPLTLEDSARLIDYKFEFRAPASPEWPTVVFLPGGPGGTSIGDEHETLPGKFGLINTDPRSVGCNKMTGEQEIPDSAISSKMLANDVAMIVKSQGLSNYVIQGVSYGTLLATVTTKTIESLSLPHPRLVVLEGVLGKAFESLEEMNEEFYAQWDRVLEKMPEGMSEQLKHNQFPFDLTSDQIGRAVQKLLMIGSQTVVSMQSAYLPDLVFALAASSDPQQQQAAKSMFDSVMEVKSHKDPAADRVYRLIACQEIAVGNNDDLKLIDGRLVPSKPDLCGDLKFGPDKYDSKKFQIADPVVYINGERDPATPVKQMRYHFESQKGGTKVSVVVPQAGHSPSGFSLSSCMPEIWGAMLSDVEEIASASAPCVEGVKVEIKK